MELLAFFALLAFFTVVLAIFLSDKKRGKLILEALRVFLRRP